MAKSHPFNFNGGEELSHMGATWFVSYAYFSLIDCNHTAWRNVKTFSSRQSIYKNTKSYHFYWLTQILSMDDNRLNTNKIGISANDTKRMTTMILKNINC